MSDNVRTVSVEWQGGMRFRGGAPGKPQTLIDADNADAPGPMLTLLVALMGCSGADIISMLAKMQVKLRRFGAEVHGTRAEDHPKRYIKIHMVITLAGDGLDEAKARRAIDLSIEKYCSVIHSLNPDIPLTYDLVLAP